MESFLSCLEEIAEVVRGIEATAYAELEQNGDQERFAQRMREKAETLASLPDCLRDANKEDLSEEILERVETFAVNAGRALALESTFYMSALLYPDDHKHGEPNTLELLIEEIRIGRTP